MSIIWILQEYVVDMRETEGLLVINIKTVDEMDNFRFALSVILSLEWDDHFTIQSRGRTLECHELQSYIIMLVCGILFCVFQPEK